MQTGRGSNPNPCPCCKVCANCPGFQQVLAAPDAGYVLYRHTTRVEDVNKKTGAIETTTDTVDDVFIVENTQGGPLGKIDFTPEIDQNKIRCPRCVHVLKHAQKLLKNQDFGKNDVMGICAHCRKFGSTCVKCEEAVEKFQRSKTTQKQGEAQRVKTWLSKIQKIIKLSLLDTKKDIKEAGKMIRSYSDVDLNNLLRKISKVDREPEIEDLFLHGIRDFYSAKRGPLSERPFYPGAMKDKGIMFYEPSKPYVDKQNEYMPIHERDRLDSFLASEKRYDTDSLMLSNITLSEYEIEKEFIHKYGKSYKSHRKYSSPADSTWFKDEDLIPIPGIRHEYEKKDSIQPTSKYDAKTEHLISPADKVYEDEIKRSKKDEWMKDYVITADKTYKHDTKKDFQSVADKDHKDKIQKEFFSLDGKHYEDDKKRDFVPERLVDYEDGQTKKLIKTAEKLLTAKQSEKKIEKKLSRETKIIYESPSRIRKYRSEESLLTGMTKMKDDVQKQKTFDYYFPDTAEVRKKEKRERVVSSSELIKDTLDKLKTKIEEEKTKREEAERLKEERRKRLEKEKKEREERLLAQKKERAIEKQLKDEDKGKELGLEKHVDSKDKLVGDGTEKDKAAKDKVVKEKRKKEAPEPKKKEKPIDSVKVEKPEKKIKENKVKEEKVKEERVKEEKVKEKKVKEEKVKEEKVKEEKIKEDKVKVEKIKEEKPKAKEIKIIEDGQDKEKEKQKREPEAQELKKKLAEEQAERERQMNELKLQREEARKQKLEAQAKAKEAAEIKKKAMKSEMAGQKFELTKIKIRKTSGEDLMQDLTKLTGPPKEIKIPSPLDYKKHLTHSKKDSHCDMCGDSDYEIEVQNILWKRDVDMENKEKVKEAVLGAQMFKYKTKFGDDEEKGLQPILFQKKYGENYGQGTVGREADEDSKHKSIKTVKPEQEYGKGIVRYALSDRTFIEKGWTKLPTEKIVRKMNVYRMRPAHPEFDWFEHNKRKGFMLYDTGEKLADFDANGRGRWYYRSGLLALDYYNAEETNAQQRFVVYSSGEPDQRGRSRPRTVLATFDYLGNGIVFDHTGKIRLKYNQTEGVVLDRTLGPVSHWKWHTLNDPPVLQRVMIDTQLSHKDPDILKLGGPGENKPRPDDEEMLAIEFDNFIKEKSAKLTQSFKPFQIKMKALKINEYFSLRVLDQANVYLIYRDGSTNIKLNIGMILDHKEIVDTDTAEVGEVSSNLERLPAKTDSLAELQRNIANAQKIERARFERDRRINRIQPTISADFLVTAASKPLKVPLLTVDSAATVGVSRFCRCRKPAYNMYYDNSLL